MGAECCADEERYEGASPICHLHDGEVKGEEGSRTMQSQRDGRQARNPLPAMLLAILKTARAELDRPPWTGEEDLPPELLTQLRALDRLIQEAEAVVDIEWGERHRGIVRGLGRLRDAAARLMVQEWVEKGYFLGNEDGAFPSSSRP